MNLEVLKRVHGADVYKSGILAGNLSRTDEGAVRFTYVKEYLGEGNPPVAFSLPLSGEPVETPHGALPAFFAGLLPEGHRLAVLKNAAKTSLDDEMTLLLAIGADVPGDVQVVPAGGTRWSPMPWPMLQPWRTLTLLSSPVPSTCTDCPVSKTRRVLRCSPPRWPRGDNATC